MKGYCYTGRLDISVNDFSVFYVWEYARIWGHCDPSLDMHVNYLEAHISKAQNAPSYIPFMVRDCSVELE